LLTLASLFPIRFVDKWKITELASFQIVSEIYQFRTSVGIYGEQRSSEEDDADESKGKKKREVSKSHLARERFTQRIMDIWNSVLESDVGTSGTLVYSAKRLYDAEAKFQFKELLEDHMNRNIYGVASNKKRVWKCWGKAEEEKWGEEDEDDFVSPMPVENYINNRGSMTRSCFRVLSPSLSTWTNFIEVLGFCITSFGAILAVLGLGEWVS